MRLFRLHAFGRYHGGCGGASQEGEECRDGPPRFGAGRGSGHEGRRVLEFRRQRAHQLGARFLGDLADLRHAERPVPQRERDFRDIAAGAESWGPVAAFLAFLRGPAAAAVITAKGMQTE